MTRGGEAERRSTSNVALTIRTTSSDKTHFSTMTMARFIPSLPAPSSDVPASWAKLKLDLAKLRAEQLADATTESSGGGDAATTSACGTAYFFLSGCTVCV